MNASDWNCRLTLPGRTYCLTIDGSCVSADSRQNGHCRSANSVTRTGALAVPRVVPFCGIPAKSAVVALAPETEPVDDAAVELDAVEPEGERAKAIRSATIPAAAPGTAPGRRRRLRRRAGAGWAVSRVPRGGGGCSRRRV